jgi:hypothetical protein
VRWGAIMRQWLWVARLGLPLVQYVILNNLSAAVKKDRTRTARDRGLIRWSGRRCGDHKTTSLGACDVRMRTFCWTRLVACSVAACSDDSQALPVAHGGKRQRRFGARGARHISFVGRVCRRRYERWMRLQASWHERQHGLQVLIVEPELQADEVVAAIGVQDVVHSAEQP